jgi:hypothetical protein
VARGGHAVANQRRQSGVLWLLLVVFGVGAFAYFLVPAASLRVVGIASDATERFLLRTLAAALLAFVPPLWLAAQPPRRPCEKYTGHVPQPVPREHVGGPAVASQVRVPARQSSPSAQTRGRAS